MALGWLRFTDEQIEAMLAAGTLRIWRGGAPNPDELLRDVEWTSAVSPDDE